MAGKQATKKFVGDAKRALAIENLTLRNIAIELGCHVTSLSRAIHSGGGRCPDVHRRAAKRLKIKPLI